MEQGSGKDRRKYFRIDFTKASEAKLLIGTTFYYVLDISEIGIRVRNPLRHKMPEDLFVAYLYIRSEQPVKVVGKVVRHDKDQVAFLLVMGIPYKIMLREQIELIKSRKTD
jgi:hypothetical protein